MSWFFQEKKQNQQPQAVKLPSNFAEQILDIELELDQPTLTLQQVTQLLELYTMAIEYYSSTKSEKYLVFMQKQQNLLKRDNVQDLINGNSKQSEVKKENQQKKDLESNIKNLQQMDKNYQVQQLINGAKDNQKKIQNIIDDDFKNQDQRVQQRIMQRIKDPVKFKNAISKSTSLRNLDIVKTEEPQVQQPIIQLEKVKEKDEQKERINMKPFNLKDLPKPSELRQQIKTANNLDDTFESPDQVSNPINIADLQNPKSRKVREIVNRNHTLKIQKKELNNVLPF